MTHEHEMPLHTEHGGAPSDIDVMARDMLRRFLISVPLMLLILPYSPLVQELTGIMMPVPPGLSARDIHRVRR